MQSFNGQRGRGGRGRGRGRGRGGNTSGTNGDASRSRDNGYGARAEHTSRDTGLPEPMSLGRFVCDYFDPNPPSGSQDQSNAPYQCTYRCNTALMLTLHKADRHLIYPPGGMEELKRQDPMLVAEEKERLRKQRQTERARAQAPQSIPSRPSTAHAVAGSDDEISDDEDDADTADRALDGPAGATIVGLNIQLDSPELIAEWINQRKKRWPSRQVIEEKERQKQERQRRSDLIYGARFPGLKRGPNEASDQERSSKAARLEKGDKARLAEAGSVVVPEGDNDAILTEPRPNAEDNVDDDDSDGAPEEASSKVPIEPPKQEATDDHRPICKHFLQGRCTFGDRCRKRHDAPASSQPSAQQPTKQYRPHPKAAPANPFDQPDLLRQLLRNEIDKHVDAVGQAIRFIVENDMLLHVETEEGQAAVQKARRSLVQIVAPSDSAVTAEASPDTPTDVLPSPSLTEPLVQGGLAVTSSVDAGSARPSLFRPASPDLRPLSDLQYPPEPDPLIFLDPLRRDDPKPLLPEQLVRIAKDTAIRAILTPSSALHPGGIKVPGLERAIVSLDALPSDFHRNAALEMILGVSGGTATPNSSAGLIVTSRDGRRKISESDLFRMGLRVGGDEIMSIKKLADRLTLLLDTTLQLDQTGEQDWGLLDAEQRDQMRRQRYSKEADRLDRLRKLGIDV